MHIARAMTTTCALDAAQLDAITDKIIAAAIRVHRNLGPGLLELTYRACLAFELAQEGSDVQTEVALPVHYSGVRIDCACRIDMVVDNHVFVAIRAVERLERVHASQLLTYLRLGNAPVGLLINFNVPLLCEGVRRVVNEFPDR